MDQSESLLLDGNQLLLEVSERRVEFHVVKCFRRFLVVLGVFNGVGVESE